MKSNRRTIIIFFLLFFLLKPTGLEAVSPFFNSIMNVPKFISMFFIIFIYLLTFRKTKRVNKTIICILLIEILSIIVCFFNKTSIYSCFVYWQSILSLMMLADSESKNLKHFLKILVAVLATYVLINFVYILLNFPNITRNTAYILGKKNMLILYVYPFILFLLIIKMLDNKRKASFIPLMLIAISFFSIFISFSATSIFACFILVFYYFFSGNKTVNKIMGKFRTKHLLIAMLLFFVFIILFNIQEHFSFLIVDILGKDLTFTGRTYIWTKTIELINSNYFGYGWDAMVYNVQSMYEWQTASDIGHAHNYILNITYKSGIISAVIYLYWLIKISQKIDKCQHLNLMNIMKIGFAIFLILTTFEAYTTNCIVLFFTGYIFINYELLFEERNE